MSYVLILLAGVFWGIIPVFVKDLIALGFTSIEIVALRVWFSALLLGIFLLLHSKKNFTIDLKDLKLFIGTGIISFVFFNYCYFNAIQMCNISVAALLLYTSPVFVMLISLPVLKEKLNKLKLMALILTMLGLTFITGVYGSGKGILGSGILFGLGSGLGYALYSIFGKFLVNKYHVLTITFYTFLVASIGVIPLIDLGQMMIKINHSSAVLLSLGIAFFCTVLPFWAYTKGLAKVEAGKAAVLATVEPLVATLLGYLIYDENLTWFKILGMSLIFCAVFILNRREHLANNLFINEK